MRRSTAFFVAILAFAAGRAAAHTGAGEAPAFSARLLHSLRRLDHLLATALLHATGLAAASTARPIARAVRWSGAAIAVGGLGLVVAQ